MSHRVLPQVDALCLFEFVRKVIDQHLIKVVSAEMRITVCAEYLDDVISDIEYRNVECSAAEVKDSDFFFFFLFESVGKCRRRRLVYNSLDLQAGDLAGIFRGLSLGIIKVGWNGDNSLFDLFAEIVFGGLFQILQYHRRNLRRSIFFAAGIYLYQFARGTGNPVRHDLFFGADFTVPPAHKPFNGKDSIYRIRYLLMASDLADKPFALIGKADNRRRKPRTS